ncbi:MAG: carotenoid oxygenase family protein [Deltaproteobacteria bacterium]|nr:MAG: carotenoid oxygenase family protein [Deltaproteobacteria bacterium]
MVTVASEQLVQEQTNAPVRTLNESLTREHSFEPLQVEGEVPKDLHGTLFRNGPGLFESFGRPYDHLFEGDGAVTAVRLQNGQAWGATRVIQSAGLLAEQAAGKPLYGFNASWFQRFPRMLRMDSKNTANTSVMIWQDRLFALMEGGKPTELSMDDLSTLGETDLGGVIPSAFSAHPHEVPSRQALYNFGMTFGKQSSIDLFELPHQGKPRMLGRLPVSSPIMLHDFMVTENYMVFFVSPAKVSIWRAMLGIGPFDKLFYWDKKGCVDVWVVPMDQPDEPIHFQTDPFFQFHFANGYEKGDEIIIDYVRYPDLGVLEALGKEPDERPANQGEWAKLTRAVLNLKTKTLTHERMWNEICDFPMIHPHRLTQTYRYMWLTTEPDGQDDQERKVNEIVKLDLETGRDQRYMFGRGQNPSEPVFVARRDGSSEDDGYILTMVYEPSLHQSYLAVMDARDMEREPLAKVWFDHHIPTTFHGRWVAA